ncbi:MAG: FliH/SctL family protein [Acidimicrobiales bacterium]
MKNRRIIGAEVSGEARAIGQPTMERTIHMDAAMSSQIDQMREAAYNEGLVEGRNQGSQEMGQRIESISAAITLSCGDLQERLERSRQSYAGGVVQLAEVIPEAVIGRTPHDEGAAILARVRAALDQLDDPQLRITVHPDDLGVVRDGLGSHPGVELASDSGLSLGEARISGGWSHAELTREAAWDAVRRSLRLDSE